MTRTIEEKNIDVLEYRIKTLEDKIANFIKYGISNKKIIKLEAQLLKYKTQLAKLT